MIPPIKNRLEARHDGPTSRLYPFIAARARQRGAAPVGPRTDGLYWDAAWWGLSQWPAWTGVSPETQTQILSDLSRYVLTEAYFIEKSGSAYAAKMMLMAKDTDTAQLYALIAADEAIHLSWIEPFVSPADKTAPQGAFLSFLSSLIETASPQVLILTVQIILEGWGLDHYRRLAAGCLDPDLTAVWAAILKDEALHHQSGIVQFDPSRLSPEEVAFIEAAFDTYIRLIASGPVGAVEVIARYVTTDDDLLTALGHPQETQRKSDLIQNLLRQSGFGFAELRFDSIRPKSAHTFLHVALVCDHND